MTSAFMKTIIVSASVLALAPARAQSARQQGGVAEGRLNPTTTSAARAEFWAGVDDWQSFSFASAIKHFRKAVAIDPSFGLARAMAVGVPPRTLAEYKSGEMDRGVGDAARASTAEGLYALAWREKAADHFERAAQLFHATMELLPNDAHVANEYVWELSFYAPKPALDSAKAIRARFPAYAPLEAAVAVFLINSGDSTAALAAAQDYLQHAPGRPAAPNLYGSILQLIGRFDEAEVQYKRQLAMEPVRADFGSDAASSLVQLYLLTNRADDARALALQELPRLGDARDSANYLATAASAALFAGDNTEAIRLLEAARRKAEYVGDASSPYPVDVLLANAHALSGDKRAVPTYLARIQPIRPSDSAQATAWRATAYARAGALDSTLKYIDRFVATSGFPASVTTPWAHMTRGVAYEHTKQCARALDELRQADTTSMDVQGALADCSFQQGDREAALRWRDRVLAQRTLNLFYLSDVDARRRMAALK